MRQAVKGKQAPGARRTAGNPIAHPRCRVNPASGCSAGGPQHLSAATKALPAHRRQPSLSPACRPCKRARADHPCLWRAVTGKGPASLTMRTAIVGGHAGRLPGRAGSSSPAACRVPVAPVTTALPRHGLPRSAGAKRRAGAGRFTSGPAASPGEDGAGDNIQPPAAPPPWDADTSAKRPARTGGAYARRDHGQEHVNESGQRLAADRCSIGSGASGAVCDECQMRP
jgi:hypothetical protein